MPTRTLKQVISAIPTSDGGGVKLLRSLGQSQYLRLDPFLMLDEFSSMNADDYIAGFPDHPHRGFETVTYILDGHMLHQDHLGHRGDLKSGSVQWMTAGRGIIHSEMPQQESGRMRGFQLWVNLPAAEKMKPAAYQDIQPEDIPQLNLRGGGQVKIIAGTAQIDDRRVSGPIQGLSTEPLFLDVRLTADAHFVHPIAQSHNAFIYIYEGGAEIGPLAERQPLGTHAAGVLSEGDSMQVHAGEEGVAFLVLAGRPLREPIVQYGPFVMNTRDEIEQAIADYRNGQLVSGRV
ncbi:pirin family protein [Methylomicrobium sp. Wu6]|uniref:pirin family protein n=1 Tax=Methylomicrobium sp. Wu6 TaxID=3107928 RepID=UPI002DD637B3|nr:pirin family protein [Methylomicrobium sp. Wu6]MEC4747199.1 pirin family protein [Methylomicrobium sp. Wu6]